MRGFISIIRKPIKSIILLGLVFILGNIIAGAISVRQAIIGTDSIIRAKMSPALTIELDGEKLVPLIEKDPDFSPEGLSIETLEKIGSLPYVKRFDYSIGTSLESRTLNRYGSDAFGPTWLTPFRFQGVSDADMIDLKEGKIILVAGRRFNEEEIENISFVAMISQNVADINKLSVGSKVGFEMNINSYDVDMNPTILASRDYEFEIIGIYVSVEQVRTKNYGYDNVSWMDEMIENRIYAPNKALLEVNTFEFNEIIKQYGEEYNELKEYAPLFILNDPLDIVKFEEEIAVFVPDYYKVTGALDGFERAADSMKSIQDISGIVLYTAVVVTVIILSLLIALFLRDRRHEIGIYMALGEKRAKIAAQIVLEVIVVAVVAITLSMFSGNILSANLSEIMILEQIAADLAGGDGFSWSVLELDLRGYYTGINYDDILKYYTVSLTPSAILLFYVIGLGTSCLSALVPILYAIRLNPKRILM